MLQVTFNEIDLIQKIMKISKDFNEKIDLIYKNKSLVIKSFSETGDILMEAELKENCFEEYNSKNGGKITLNSKNLYYLLSIFNQNSGKLKFEVDVDNKGLPWELFISIENLQQNIIQDSKLHILNNYDNSDDLMNINYDNYDTKFIIDIQEMRNIINNCVNTKSNINLFIDDEKRLVFKYYSFEYDIENCFTKILPNNYVLFKSKENLDISFEVDQLKHLFNNNLFKEVEISIFENKNYLLFDLKNEKYNIKLIKTGRIKN